MRRIRMIEAISEAIVEEMDRDERVMTWGEDVALNGGPFGATVLASKKYFSDNVAVDRCLDTPISEAAIVGSAVGAAMMGLRPVVEIGFIDFTTCAMDEIFNQIAKTRYMLGGQVKVPMVFRTTCGGGLMNAAQHSQSWDGLYLHVPGYKIIMPSTPHDAKGLLKSAIRDDDPVISIEHRAMNGSWGDVPEEEYLIPLGVAAVKRPGKDITVVATSQMVHKSLAAAERLEKDGISIEIIDPRTIFPLDMDTITTSLAKTGRLLVAEEGVARCGFSAYLITRIAQEHFALLHTAPQRVCALEIPIPFSPVLENYCLPQVEDIVLAAKKMMQ